MTLFSRCGAGLGESTEQVLINGDLMFGEVNVSNIDIHCGQREDAAMAVAQQCVLVQQDEPANGDLTFGRHTAFKCTPV